MEYPRVKQLMQMFVFEMTQMMVARGGQVVFSSVQLSPGVPKLWQDKPVVASARYIMAFRLHFGPMAAWRRR